MNNSLRNLAVVAVLGILIIGGYFAFNKKSATLTQQNFNIKERVVETETATTTTIVNKGPELKILTLRDKAWIAFEKYLDAAKIHDIALVKTLSYQQSPTCADPKTEKNCLGLMDNLYSIGSALKKDDYKNIWSDDKQIILFTNPVPTRSDDIYGYKKGFIFFTVDKDGAIKILAIDPEQGWGVKKENNITDREVQDKLEVFMRDSDQDGLTDRAEQCPTSASDPSLGCVKTDPNKRDTNGNGWWDGVEFYFYKK